MAARDVSMVSLLAKQNCSYRRKSLRMYTKLRTTLGSGAICEERKARKGMRMKSHTCQMRGEHGHIREGRMAIVKEALVQGPRALTLGV